MQSRNAHSKCRLQGKGILGSHVVNPILYSATLVELLMALLRIVARLTATLLRMSSSGLHSDMRVMLQHVGWGGSIGAVAVEMREQSALASSAHHHRRAGVASSLGTCAQAEGSLV